MRPNCECCDRNLSPSAHDVWICSFECTWCDDCRAGFAEHRCPNCGGVLTARPPRAPEKLLSAPASTARILNPDCLAALSKRTQQA